MGQNYESLLISIMRYIVVNKIQAHLSVGRYGLNRHTMIIVSGNLVPAIMYIIVLREIRREVFFMFHLHLKETLTVMKWLQSLRWNAGERIYIRYYEGVAEPFLSESARSSPSRSGRKRRDSNIITMVLEYRFSKKQITK